MTIEQVKEEAKKRFDKDLTDEQAQAFLEAHPAGELQDEELADVAGGGCGSDPEPRKPQPVPVCAADCCSKFEFGRSSYRECKNCKYCYFNQGTRECWCNHPDKMH